MLACRLFALAVLAQGERYVLGDLFDDLVDRIDQALSLLAEDDVGLRARLLARKAAALTPAQDVSATLAMADEAARLAAQSGDPTTRLQVAIGVGAAMAAFAPPATSS